MPDPRDDAEARFLRHRDDQLRSVGSPGIGGGTGGAADQPEPSDAAPVADVDAIDDERPDDEVEDGEVRRDPASE